MMRVGRTAVGDDVCVVGEGGERTKSQNSGSEMGVASGPRPKKLPPATVVINIVNQVLYHTTLHSLR